VNEIRSFLLVLGAELKRLFAYRVQFWFELIASSLVELGVALIVWRAVFEAIGGTTVSGYTFSEMILYITAATFTGHAIRGTGMGTFARDIYDGAYTRYLVYPLSVYAYKFAIFFARTFIAILQLLLALCVLWLGGYMPQDAGMNLASLLAGLGFLLFASYLYFLFIIITESVAFWADNVWAVSSMMQICVMFFSGKMIPLDMFPLWLQQILEWSPFPLLVFVPVNIVLGDRLSEMFMHTVLLFGWIALAFVISKTIIARGNLRYSGVGI
jgi:ABC-2 type transport system permease protein